MHPVPQSPLHLAESALLPPIQTRSTSRSTERLAAGRCSTLAWGCRTGSAQVGYTRSRCLQLKRLFVNPGFSRYKRYEPTHLYYHIFLLKLLKIGAIDFHISWSYRFAPPADRSHSTCSLTVSYSSPWFRTHSGTWKDECCSGSSLGFCICRRSYPWYPWSRCCLVSVHTWPFRISHL